MPDGSTQLSFASIDDNQLRQRLPFSHHTRITTVKDLFHGSEIVCADNSLYIEMAVIATSRFSIPEDHTTRDRICALDIGVVKTFYMAWLRLQTEITFHLRHQFLHTPLGIQFLRLLLDIVHILRGIL